MKNWKYDLFSYRQNLTLEQLEISSIIEGHLQAFDKFSEKELVYSLKENLKSFSYDESVTKLLESMDAEIDNASLVYSLKDLYKKIERRDHGMLYRDPLNKILDCINLDTDEERMECILTNLALYDYIPEMKSFVFNLTTDPMDRKNMTSSGAKGSKVITYVDSVNEGYIAYVGDRWFVFGENDVKEALVSDYFKGEDLAKIYNIQKAFEMSMFDDNKINFIVDENLSLKIGMDGKMYLNEEVIDKETSMEDLFNSPIIPMMKKSYYPIIKTVVESLDKFVDLDVNTKISSLTNPMNEMYVFNYKDKLYMYNVDRRTGSRFFEYESVNQLVEDVQAGMGYDISDFVSNKLSKEMRQYKKLEDREQKIQTKIKEVQESLEALESEGDLLKESVELKTAFDSLVSYKQELVNNLQRIKNAKVNERKRLL